MSLITACGGGGGSGSAASAVVDGSTEPDDFLRFVNLSLDINSTEYAQKYYDTVDPDSKRTTLAAWKAANGFEQAAEIIQATFRDTKDLGYGRDMYAWLNPNGCGFAIYVDNYVVQLEPGDATTYGVLNLDAAIAQDRRYLVGSNAIEYSPLDNNVTTCTPAFDPTDPNAPADPSPYKIAKFYTFSPANSASAQTRRLQADLDGRGLKAVPVACVICHGASMYPLQRDGTFDPVSLKSSHLNILEQNTFEFHRSPGFREADQQGNIKAINRLIYRSYIETGARADEVPPVAPADGDLDRGNWNSDFSEEILSGAYSNISDDSAVDPYSADFVPAGWRESVTPARSKDVEDLYRRVIGPYCVNCHATRGNKSSANTGANAVNFSTYEDFKKYNDLIVDYVFRRGSMPRSLLSYSLFWAKDGSGTAPLPKLLAGYLDPLADGFSMLDADGNAVKPGRALAIAGGDRVAPSPLELSAQASLFSSRYSWSIVSSSDPSAALQNADAPVATLFAADLSDTVIKLVTANGRGESQPIQINVTIDNSIGAPLPFRAVDAGGADRDATPAASAPYTLADVNAALDIEELIDMQCVGCHSSGGARSVVGIPVYWNDQDTDTQYPRSDREDRYRRVLSRVDLIDPLNSLFLRKPTLLSTPHGGGLVLNLNGADSAEREKDVRMYHKLLNWISAGAPCGTHAMCP